MFSASTSIPGPVGYAADSSRDRQYSGFGRSSDYSNLNAQRSSYGGSFSSARTSPLSPVVSQAKTEYLPSLLVSPPSYAAAQESKSPYSASSELRSSYSDLRRSESLGFAAPPANSLLESPWPGATGNSSYDQQYLRRRRGRDDLSGVSKERRDSVSEGTDRRPLHSMEPPPFRSLLTDADITSAYDPRTPVKDASGATNNVTPGVSSMALDSPLPSNSLEGELSLRSGRGGEGRVLTSGSRAHWVTVFGFQPNQVSAILTRFQSFGDVVRHRVGPGNWLHIQYETKLQAEKALSQNGKVVEGTTMLGVAPCAAEVMAQLGYDPVTNEEVYRGSSSRLMSRAQRHTRSFSVVDDSSDLLRAPVKRGSLCTRIMEYLFNI